MEQQTQSPVAEGAPAATATSELPPGGVAPPADGGVVDPSTQPAEAVPPQPTPEEEARARNRKEQRFSELSRRANDAEREAAYWRGIAEGKGLVQNGQPEPRPAPQPAPAANSGAPDPNDFDRYPLGAIDPQYVNDLTDWKLEQREAAKAKKAAEDRDFEIRRERWVSANVEADKLGFTGAREVLKVASQEIADAICATGPENGALLSEYFYQYPDHYERVAKLDSVSRAVQFGYIVADLRRQVAGQATPPAPTPPAPPPAAPAQSAPAAQPNPTLQATPTVNGRTATPAFNPETASMADWEARLSAVRSGAIQPGR